MNEIKKIVLAYSGGLDTSVIIPWLKENYKGAEVIAACADVGQPDDFPAIEKKAYASGASKVYIMDIKKEFLEEYVWPVVKAGCVYEGKYLLGTSFARPLISKKLVEVARKEGADAIAHGATGKGNDQVRFELTVKALAPDIKLIAPWRIWDIKSREDALTYAAAHNVPIAHQTEGEPYPYSMDWNIWHLSHEGADLENPANAPKDMVYMVTTPPEKAPDMPEYPEAPEAKRRNPEQSGRRGNRNPEHPSGSHRTPPRRSSDSAHPKGEARGARTQSAGYCSSRALRSGEHLPPPASPPFSRP